MSGYTSRKCANAPRMTELLVTMTKKNFKRQILINNNSRAENRGWVGEPIINVYGLTVEKYRFI